MAAEPLLELDVEALGEAVASIVLQRMREDRDDRPLYTPNTLAERLNLNPRTVRDLLHKEPVQIRSFKIGGSRRIDPGEVDAYLQRCRQAE